MGKKETPKLSEEARKKIRMVSLVGIAIIAMLSLLSVGLYKVHHYVQHNVAFSAEPPQVVLKDRPVWMSDFLADQICTAARPKGGHSALDSQMLLDVKATLESNVRTNAWIKQIRQLRLEYRHHPGDTLVLDCEFRVPVALVKSGNFYYLVDGDCYALPELYTADQIGKIIYGSDGKVNIRVVEGISNSRPKSPGQQWQGDDLAAAIRMVKELYGKPFTEEIVKVDVSNFAGRVDARESQIVLWTNHTPATQIRWGRPIVAKEDISEVPARQKLQNLQTIFQRFGRIDARQMWLDVRFDRVTYPSEPPAATASNQ